MINSPFHEEWDNYFDTAIFFSIVWFFAMFFINRRQRIDMEREQLKAIELEKEFQQSENLKAKLEVQVAERTAEILGQKEELQKALDKLKATQAQLIQSEKMASLGELTAGIAHEIQNPLNFVNNFSEVSSELLEEMNEEIEKGDFEEVKNIAADIKQNLEKINHHGKRADSIVKGMLQHSRASSGQKEPTDINALADEYLRLAYHGLRAKDKSFNTELETNFDTNLPKAKVIPQDIGRVLLNLFTNAFYTTHQKQKTSSIEYKPLVSVTTSFNENRVEIVVKDNGSGIPKAIKNKIMQPFFTTKPTGEGTGLGLSLSYDIVKAHDGELKVETIEGEGSTFIISLPLNI
ncbi:signal transduction histidine kinase [Flavobacterium granuli]|uniref:histidine kinase n=2 Tax=Flavobacterium granuli TaxID=280093 RepID=A0ABU1S4Q5_9FLAO|nr:signal transduction histidine kinase [Flavobacterium granuli]